MAKPRQATAPDKTAIPKKLPILPSGDAVAFPGMLIPLGTESERVIRLIDEAASGDRVVGIFAQRPGTEAPLPENLYSMGTAATIVRMFKMPDGSIRAFLQGQARIRMTRVTRTEPYIQAQVEEIAETAQQGPELEALTQNLATLFRRVVELAPNLPEELNIAAINIPEPGPLADFVAAHINISLEESQQLLETLDIAERLLKLTTFLNREIEVLELGSKIQSQAREEMTKAQREFYLREQLKAIQRELGESDERTAELSELRQKIDEAGLPKEALKEAERELDRLSRMSPASAEYSVARTYLDWVTSLPWNQSTQDSLDVEEAARVLDQDHYDLEKVKGRILEYLAVKKLKPDMKGPILCFVGPPGTGKTSMGQSIARALGRKFARMSLGGIRDEADVRGHRRTYIGV